MRGSWFYLFACYLVHQNYFSQELEGEWKGFLYY